MTPEGNPLLTTDRHPRFDAIRPEHVVPAVERAIADHRAAMRACGAMAGFDAIFECKDRADAALSFVWRTVQHLLAVVNTPALRSAHAEAQPLIDGYLSESGQDRVLYNALKQIPADTLPSGDARALRLAMHSFELAGVALNARDRAGFAANRIEQGRLSTGFADALMDATEAWTLLLTDEGRLAGVPVQTRTALRSAAQAEGLEGWLVDLHMPTVQAVLSFADDRDLREQLYRAFGTRASDEGPHAGRFDNGPRIERLLALRREEATALGHADPVALSLASKMAENFDEIENLLLDLARRARPRATDEYAELTRFGRTRFGLDAIEPWDIGYLTEHLRRDRHALDQEMIRRHLPLDRVMAGLFGLVAELYGVEIRIGGPVPVWHADVGYFTLHRKDAATPFAAFYCDLFARAGKRGGAWMNVCHARIAAEARIPTAYLVCNFASPEAGQTAYLSHSEMVTLFHEMGHCLHHLLTEIDLPSVSGIAGVEWDAIELPSQFMENFAWNADMLRRLSMDSDSGQPLAWATIERMLAARHFMGGLALLRQIEFALFDLRLHRAAADSDPSPTAILQSVRAEVAVVSIPDWHRFAHGFSHIFAGGYAAGYYSYLWAQRLSADAFEAFGEAGADRRAVGERFLREVLSRGGSRPALDNYTAFRGRAADNGALLRAWGIAA